MKIITSGLSLAAFILLSACAHKTPVTDGKTVKFCNFTRYHLSLDHRNNPSLAALNTESLKDVFTEGFSPTSTSPIAKGDMLFLSGGSLNGAFGAGVLAGWAEKDEDGKLPNFSVVTGVSTGAILSLAAFTNVPEAATDAYKIESESDAITAFVGRNNKGEVGLSSYVTAMRKGALADLAPLQDSIYKAAATHELFDLIAKGADDNRKLLAGVVDVDTGKALALDMTLMAREIREYILKEKSELKEDEKLETLIKRDSGLGHLVDCFTRGIAASSSVPLAARPIAIDNRLYIDGGARFLLFSDIIGPVIEADVDFNITKDKKVFEPINIYMLINGDQTITPKCAKKNGCDDNADTDINYWAMRGARKDWNVLDLVERTVDVLQTQVGEFSESEIRFRTLELALARAGINLDELLVDGAPKLFSRRSQRGPKGEAIPLMGNDEDDVLVEIVASYLARRPVHFTVNSNDEPDLNKITKTIRNNFKNYRLHSKKITAKTLQSKYPPNDPEQKTCAEWLDHEKKTTGNLQFFPTYMKCMIEAGREESWGEGTP